MRTGAVNLGQGFPDTDGPAEMLEAAAEALRGGRNQYPPGPGIPELRAAIAAHQRRFWGLDYDPDGEILVTAGATEAIAAACSPCASRATRWSASSRTTTRTPPAIALAGAVRRPVTLRPGPTAGTPSTRRSCAPRSARGPGWCC